MENLYQTYKDEGDGFLAIQLIGANVNGYPPSVQNLQNWINLVQTAEGVLITYILLADTNFGVGNLYNPTIYIPYYWLVDQNLVIQQKSSFVGTFSTKIEELLGID